MCILRSPSLFLSLFTFVSLFLSIFLCPPLFVYLCLYLSLSLSLLFLSLFIFVSFLSINPHTHPTFALTLTPLRWRYNHTISWDSEKTSLDFDANLSKDGNPGLFLISLMKSLTNFLRLQHHLNWHNYFSAFFRSLLFVCKLSHRCCIHLSHNTNESFPIEMGYNHPSEMRIDVVNIM